MHGGLIVETDDGLQFFKTSEALEGYAEAIDVENGEYGRVGTRNGWRQVSGCLGTR